MTVDDVEYSLNDEFKEQTYQLADALALDQVEAFSLLLQGQQVASDLDRSPLACAIIRFHEYRTYLVDSLRLLGELCLDEDLNDGIRDALKSRFDLILKDEATKRVSGSTCTQKCARMMLQIEQWLNRLAEQMQKMIAVGQVSSADHDEVMGIQQHNLTQQHESLGATMTFLIKLKFTSLDDLRKLLGQMRQVDKWNILAIHYVPSLISFFDTFGSSYGISTHAEARTIHRAIVDAIDSNPWPLRQLQAAVTTWWLAEYNSWYFDMPEDHAAIEDEDAEKEEEARSEALTKAIRNGAFQCTLSICSQIKSSDWYDPARLGLIRSLLNDAPVLPFEPASISSYFREMLLEHFDRFTYSFISCMPDQLRKFKSDEEDQRRRFLAGFPTTVQNDIEEPDRHLERFFVIMSYAYEGRPESAAEFWTSSDSILFGFLQWFSQRVSTPIMGAFCEMFRAISEGDDNAAAAHSF